MVLFFEGKTKCALCGKVIERLEDSLCFPAFLPRDHRFGFLSDAAVHVTCFRRWQYRKEFEQLYRSYRSIWDNRPKELDSIEDIDQWGREAFKNLGQD